MTNGDRRARIVAQLLLLVAFTVVVLVFWRRDGDLPVAPTSDAPADATATPRSADSAEPTTAPRQPIPDQAATAPPDRPLLAHVRGRCVDEHGTPLAGCVAEFGGWGRSRSAVALQGDVPWQDPEPVTSGGDGRFDIAFAPPSGFQYTLDVQADGRVPRTGRWGAILPDQVIDLGDIRLERGFVVRGQVVDEQARPVAKVGVGIENLPLPLAPDMAANDSRSGWSDERGAFEVRVPIPPGTWPLDVRVRGFRLVGPDRVTVDPSSGAEPLVVVVRRMPTIEGLVVDEFGAPVAGVRIGAELNRSGRMASGRSGDDGRFTIHAVDAEPTPVQLRVDDPGPCEPPAEPDARIWEWGSADVRIELKRALSFELTVVESRSGVPVSEYAVSCYSERSRSSLQRDLRLSGEHPGGRVTVDRVWRGRNFVRVIPLDEALMPSDIVEFDVTDLGAPPLRVEVERLLPVHVRVTTSDGEPVAGSSVEVIRKGTREARNPFEMPVAGRGGVGSFSSEPRTRLPERLSQAVTGPDGRAALHAPMQGAELTVRVVGEHPPCSVDPAAFVDGRDLVVVVPESGDLVGVVRLAGLDPARIRASLFGADGREVGRDRFARGDVGALDGDGRFAIRGLTPGEYGLRLGYSVRYQTSHGSGGTAVPLALEIPAVTIVAGQPTEVTIDASALSPGTLRGRVLLDGVVPAARVFLQADGGRRWGQYAPDAQGGFVADGLLPGRYRAGLVVGDFQAGDGDSLVHPDTFEVRAGDELERAFAFTRRKLVVRMVNADGSPAAAGLRFAVRGTETYRDCSTDASGSLVLDPAPAGEIRLLTSNDLLPDPATVMMPTDKASFEVTVTLRERGAGR